jgi:SAM-dependent methyltransferase
MTAGPEFAAERAAIGDRYARRTRRYPPHDPWVLATAQELDRALAAWLRASWPDGPAGLRLLEIGCGTGRNLQRLQGLGFRPEQLTGNELLPDRVAAARANLPAAVRIVPGDALALPAPDGGYDVVFQSLVFSSILDAGFRQALAAHLWSLARPGGGVLWYDFTVDNPANPDVRGVPVRELRRLFPAARPVVRRVTLAPPLGRLACRLHPALYHVANALPLLRTHVLCWLPKPAGG